MSTGTMVEKMVCKIDKGDKTCSKNDCINCRHWIKKEVWQEFIDVKGIKINGDN